MQSRLFPTLGKYLFVGASAVGGQVACSYLYAKNLEKDHAELKRKYPTETPALVYHPRGDYNGFWRYERQQSSSTKETSLRR